jgi:hypothetical protein
MYIKFVILWFLRKTVTRTMIMTMMARGMYTPYIRPTGVTHLFLNTKHIRMYSGI